MQLMCDGVAGVGSRVGIMIDPMGRECRLVRFDSFLQLKRVGVRAGVRLAGKTYVFPLTALREGDVEFRFCDQRTSPCTISVTGIVAEAGVKVKLTLAVPFRPRDEAYATVPVVMAKVEISQFQGGFRWDPRTVKDTRAEIFFEVENGRDGRAMDILPTGQREVELRWESNRRIWPAQELPPEQRSKQVQEQKVGQVDRLVGLNGERRGNEFVLPVELKEEPQGMEVAWCNWNADAMQVHGQMRPFAYGERFGSLETVVTWACANGQGIFENARKVDGLVGANDAGPAVNHLLAYTLHSWMMCTWWAKGWFSVWEGSCHFHSTVDVEFTQAPFYLAVWPELLGMELDQWPAFAQDGSKCVGDRGQGTLYLSHDCGQDGSADYQQYQHPMEVEETGNYLLMAYAHWRRTGDDTIVRKHADTIEKFLHFLVASDSTGDGVPDEGVANTIDDASPAVQFGKKQVYLASKTLAAFVVGEKLANHLGRRTLAELCALRAKLVRSTIEAKGWQGDHYGVLTEKGGQLTNSWTGQTFAAQEIPGWNASHIYTENGWAVLDMVGVDVGLDRARVKQDLEVAARRCLREYGCIHSDYITAQVTTETQAGLMGGAASPGWVAMNLYRDLAALYRGVDLRRLAERYWEWQVTTNTQEPKMFFETFNGNNLCFYPRGVVIWGWFDALAGRVIDKVAGMDQDSGSLDGGKLGNGRAPRWLDAAWIAGK